VSIKGLNPLGATKKRETRKKLDMFTKLKALTFLAERGFSRTLRQYGRSKFDRICRRSFNFNITFGNATCAKDKIILKTTGQKIRASVGEPSDFIWLVTEHAFGFYNVATLTFS